MSATDQPLPGEADPERKDSHEKEPGGLEGLPDELLLAVAKNLECTRDLAALAQSSKRLQRCVDSSTAWRDFVAMKFPCATIPEKTSGNNYKVLAESMTYQARCWDRRSIRFSLMYPARQPQERAPGNAFATLVDVDYDVHSGRETLVWGAGEDIVARYRQKETGQGRTKKTFVSWRKMPGTQHGFRSGVDDVTAMDIVKLPHLKGPAMLVGRANGDLSLLSAQSDDNFGQQLASFSPSHFGGPEREHGNPAHRQSQIMAVDVLNDGKQSLAAACTNLGVCIYQLPQDTDTTTVSPVHVYDTSSPATQQIWNAKWMGSRNLLAIASRVAQSPLRYLTATPTGYVAVAAAKNAQLHAELQLGNSSIQDGSLTPVHRYPGMKDPTPLLLSAWQDGTVRLQDIRTPSPFDTVYQDNVIPGSSYGTLLSFGSDRFVAGDNGDAMIKIFDFRWPRPYHHTTGLPCGAQYPFRFVEQRFVPRPPDPSQGRSRCDPLSQVRCRWHALSRELYYRPNAHLMFNTSLPLHLRRSRVNSLAAASDLAPTFYMGINGAVVECNLGRVDGDPEDVDRHLGLPDYRAPRRWSGNPSGYLTQPLAATMMEVGDGLRNLGNEANIVMPLVHTRHRGEAERQLLLRTIEPALRRKHRLDERFQRVKDFSQDVDWEGAAEELARV